MPRAGKTKKGPYEKVCEMCDKPFWARRHVDRFCLEQGECSERAKYVYRAYRLKPMEYRRLISSGRCDACGEPARGRMSVDHCHETGKVRGWVHQSCNLGIGQAGNEGERLESWQRYMARGSFDIRDLLAA